MLKRSVLCILAVSLFSFAAMDGSPRALCEGFLPENDLAIPIGSSQAKGITEAQFNQVLDKIQEIYGPAVAAQGGTLQINRLWENETVNASAQRWGSTYIINMYGGLARHKSITQDGFALVACHEMGHHLGGAPKKWGWASNEGQSDYYANLKCLRTVFALPEAAAFTGPKETDPVAAAACAQVWGAGSATCKRASMAGWSVTDLFKALRNEEKDPAFDTPDPRVVDSTDGNHPATQCRLDTYFQGSLCDKAVDEALDDRDPAKGTCARSNNYTVGVRPLCWYKPPAGAADLVKVPKAFAKENSAFSQLGAWH